MVDNYSIKQYCLNMLKYADALAAASPNKADALRQLVADLLNYGEKAQLYKDYKQLFLANSGLTVEASANRELTDADDKKITGTISDGSAFTSATFMLSNTIDAYVYFATNADNVANGLVSVTVDGKSVAFKATDRATTKAAQEGMTVYEVMAGSVYAGDLEKPYVVVLNVNGKTQTLSYSFVNYLYSKQNDTDVELVALANSVRNYGLSAVAYRDAE